MKTFVHKFSRTVSCTLEIEDTPPEKGVQHEFNVVWDGDPKPKHMREYIRWMNEVNRQLADEWQMKLMQVFLVTPNPSQAEIWEYEPGKPPRRANDPPADSPEQVDPPEQPEPESGTIRFGPFENIPADGIRPAGFTCRECKTPVRKVGLPVPGIVPRVMTYACKCGGSVMTWEDEKQPTNADTWSMNLALMKKNNAEVIVFNGNKRTPPSFSGIN
jgi:hypothetical protein